MVVRNTHSQTVMRRRFTGAPARRRGSPRAPGRAPCAATPSATRRSPAARAASSTGSARGAIRRRSARESGRPGVHWLACGMSLTLTRVNSSGKNFDSSEIMGLRDDAAGPVAGGRLPARFPLDGFRARLRDWPLPLAVHAQERRGDAQFARQLLLRVVLFRERGGEPDVVVALLPLRNVDPVLVRHGVNVYLGPTARACQH